MLWVVVCFQSRRLTICKHGLFTANRWAKRPWKMPDTRIGPWNRSQYCRSKSQSHLNWFVFLIFKSHFMICRMIWICRSSPLKKSNQNCMLWCCCFVVLTTGQVTKPSPKQNKKWEIWVINMFRIALLGWFMKWKVYQLHFFIIYSLQGRCHGDNNDLWLWFAIGQITGIYEWIFLI